MNTRRDAVAPAESADASLDPDLLAELEREQEFLLRSLDDLDAELRAGDLDGDDHAALTDDYTRRLAEVTRAIENERLAFAEVETRLSSKQRVVTIVGVVVLALIAGLLLARASGFRAPQDSSSGDIRRSSAGLLSEADTLTREGRWEEAVEVYDEVLDLSPANVEALTYRGWLTARLGDPEAGLVDLTEAVAVDAEFPDARVFSAILLDDEQRFDEAAEQLAALDTLDPPQEILSLVTASNLRASVAAGQIAERFSPGEPVVLDEINATLDDIARAAAVFLEVGDPVRAIATLDAVLEADPEQLVALVTKGQLARNPQIIETAPELAAESLTLLDTAVGLEPNAPEIRLYRADARMLAGDLDGARADLEVIDAELLGDELRAFFDQLDAALS